MHCGDRCGHRGHLSRDPSRRQKYPRAAHEVDISIVKNSHFVESREGHHIKSRAQRTEVIGNDIQDGPRGTASYLVDIPEGGSLVIEGNTLVSIAIESILLGALRCRRISPSPKCLGSPRQPYCALARS
jgi:hypothetical protein